MPTISDIFDKPTPLQAAIGTDLAYLGGFGKPSPGTTLGTRWAATGLAAPSELAKTSFMGGARHELSAARTLAKHGMKGAAGKALARGAFGAALPGMGLYFMGKAGITGFKEGGVTGAATGMAGEAAFWVGTTMAFRALANPVGLAAVAGTAATAAAGYGLYKAGEASWQYHLKSLPLETTGSLSAFQTSGAATMRQRSVMNIQRSHLNARSAFGNEAQYAHIARYRGVGRRGLM